MSAVAGGGCGGNISGHNGGIVYCIGRRLHVATMCFHTIFVCPQQTKKFLNDFQSLMNFCIFTTYSKSETKGDTTCCTKTYTIIMLLKIGLLDFYTKCTECT